MSLLTKASLIATPTAYGDGVLNSVKPTNGDGDFDFARASAATRVNEQGLIEKERGNLLLQSNSFDTTWLNVNSTETGGQSGYDGTNNAWKLEKFASAARLYQNITYSGVNTFSVYAKAGTLNHLMINNATNSVFFDIQNGSVGTNTAGGGSVDASIEAVGATGWYRISVVSNVSSTTIRIYPAQADNDFTGTSGYVYIQDAQLEQGLVATDYIETTTAAVYEGITDDIPRINYENGIGSFLLEPRRTNFIPHSEYFSDWVLDGDGTSQSVTANYATSPEGVQNAYRLQLNKTGGTYSRIRKSVTSSYSGAGIFSVYLKTNDASTKTISMRWGGSGVIEKTITGEWQRFDAQGTATSGLASDCEIFIVDAQNSIVDLSVYGAQLEAGSYATSYIPTYGTSVTFASDSCSKTGISSLIGQTEGTLFLDFVAQTTTTAQSHIWLGASGSEIGLYGPSSFIFYSSGGVSISGGAFVTGQRYKIAFAYKANDYVAYVNGVQKGTDTSATVPAMSALYINSYSDFTEIQKKEVNQALLFKTRLTNAELADLTTL